MIAGAAFERNGFRHGGFGSHLNAGTVQEARWMDASPEVKILTGVAFMAALYLLTLIMEEQRRFRRLTRWLEAAHPGRWSALPWMLRCINHIGAIDALSQQGLRRDRKFAELCAGLNTVEAKHWLAGLVGATAMFLVLVGTRYWNWAW